MHHGDVLSEPPRLYPQKSKQQNTDLCIGPKPSPQKYGILKPEFHGSVHKWFVLGESLIEYLNKIVFLLKIMSEINNMNEWINGYGS